MPNVNQPFFDDTDDDAPEGFRSQCARIGRQAGGERLGASVWDLAPGQAICPYHWHAMEEEMLLVLRGRPSLRTPEGWRELEEGDLVAFPTGERGAHQIKNSSGGEVRVLVISEQSRHEICGYPDEEKLGVFGPKRALFFERDAVGYWD